jgi:S1-C subfamily serine protease
MAGKFRTLGASSAVAGATLDVGTLTSLSAAATVGGQRLTGLLQTTAQVVPAQETGGPLVDLSGQVIGIDVAGAGSGLHNIGYAVPINQACRSLAVSITERERFTMAAATAQRRFPPADPHEAVSEKRGSPSSLNSRQAERGDRESSPAARTCRSLKAAAAWSENDSSLPGSIQR